MTWWKILSPATRVVIQLTGGLLIIGGILYIVTTVVTTQADAFDIATGTGSPYALNAGTAGVLLAIVGYLFAPAIVGTILAAVLDAKTQRDRAATLEEVRPIITEEIGRRLPPPPRGGATGPTPATPAPQPPQPEGKTPL